MKLISEFSMGAPFIFVPYKWMKGNHPREPADLVWACNGCIILMYLQRTKSYKDLIKNTRKCHDAIEHNLRQAEGWLKEWKAGRTLEGQNSYSSFTIPYEKYKHIVILSVIECGDAMAKYHHSKTIKLGVTMCATLPLSVVERLAKLRASIVDFIAIVHNTLFSVSEQAEIDALAAVSVYQKQVWELSGALRIWPERVDKRFFEIEHLLHGLRYPFPKMQPNIINNYPDDASDKACIFNDISLEDFLKIIVKSRICIDAVKDWQSLLELGFILPSQHGVVCHHLHLQNYDFTLCALPKVGPPELTKIGIEYAKKNSRRGEYEPGIIIFYLGIVQPGFFTPLMIIQPRNRASTTEMMLDAWYQQQYNASG
ncbi:hypothetical protein [Allocoleopsis sp.]|uniref:hypothetical protein n=1 Tax=Allocoleopsis sp. TaxID=3088169 RepID=UPI002FD3373E